jgi:hypothetical protein
LRRACFQSLRRHIFNGLFTGEEFSDWSTTIVVMAAFDSGQLASLWSLAEVFGSMCLILGEGEGKTRGRSTQKSRGGSGTSPRERRLGKEPNSDPRISRIPRPTETPGGGNSRAHGVTDWTRTDFATAQTEHNRPLRFGYPGRTKCIRMSTTIQ